MSHYKPYPAYKDSGVEWLGRVPEHWDITPLKYEAEFVNGAAFKPEQWTEAGTPIIRIENLNGSLNFNCFDGEVDARYHVFQGDLLFGWSGNRGTSFGPFIWAHEGRHFLNQHIFRICNFDFYRSWFYWSLKAVTAHVEDQAHGIIGMVHVTKGDLGSIKIATPKLYEQQVIAKHLDRETTRIDTLIAKKTRFIELLKEKRQTLITQAVTKGLNPNVKMKDSGVEWLGAVPEHWEVRPVKYLVEPKSGAIKTGPFGSQLTSDEMNSGTIKVYNQRNVIDGDLFSGENFISDDKFRQLSSFEVFPEDVLITTRGTIGRVIVAPKDLEKGILHPCLMRVRINKNLLIVYFFSMLLGESHLLQSQIAHMSNASTIEVIYSETMGALLLPVPPINEQKNILFQVRKASEKFYRLISKTQLSITLLKERRSALITAAVTGQIDLREAA